MSNEINEVVPTPKPTPTPKYSFWQLLLMLLQSLLSGVTGAGSLVTGGFGHIWGRVQSAAKNSLVVSILLAGIAGFMGGKATQMELPQISGCGDILSWISGWLPHPGPAPTPVPPPSPAPIPAKGLHVLVVGDEGKMTGPQINALKSAEVRTYLNTTCPKGPDGKAAEYRIWPTGVDVSNESQLWKDAYAKTTGKAFPWIIVSNPDHGGGFEGPLPADQPTLLALLKKFGG